MHCLDRRTPVSMPRACLAKALEALCITFYNNTYSYFTHTDCDTGFYGQSCKPCSPQCQTVCSTTTGSCTCMNNATLVGPKCDESCPVNCKSKCNNDLSCRDGCKPGFYGTTCNQSCSKACVTGSTTGMCNQINGYCDSCTTGFWGNRCEGRCSSHCDPSSCNKADGSCTCTPGYKPNTCINGM